MRLIRVMLVGLLGCFAVSDTWAERSGGPRAYLRWASRQQVVEHPEDYRFLAEIHAAISPWVRRQPDVVRPFRAGRTVKNRPIWAFRVRRPATQTRKRVLVFAGTHALEWISSEVATAFVEEIARHPVDGVEVVVVPVLNVDRRLTVEKDLLAGRRKYRRSNANGVDLNRDYEIHREARAFWRHIIPGYYKTSPAPLSQPESQTIDRLGAEGFDVAISLHAFGGFIYYPWSGLWSRPEDHADFVRLGQVMERGQGAHAYRTRQLSRWGFFFRAHGSELDHLYGKYGTHTFLIELTRSGLEPLRPSTRKVPFRWYNPRDPRRHVRQGVGALRALVHHLGWESPTN